MAVDRKKMKVTKQTWTLLVVLLLSIIGYYSLGNTDSSPTIPVAVGITAGKNGTNVAPVQASIAAVQPVAASGAARDPFQMPPAYRQVNKSDMTETVNTQPSVTTDNMNNKVTNNMAKPMELPQLRGTVIGAAASAAILALGTESRPVRVGDTIGDYRLVAVAADSAILAGPNGLITLQMRRAE